MKKVLIVCLGNICRSPSAEAVLRAMAKKMEIDIEVDSAGTINFHQGNSPDRRSIEAGKARGYSFKGIRSRPIDVADFEYFDLILAADNQNVADLKVMCPQHLQYKISLFLTYADTNLERQEIPDPYYGGDNGFELVLDLLEDASIKLLNKINSANNKP